MRSAHKKLLVRGGITLGVAGMAIGVACATAACGAVWTSTAQIVVSDAGSTLADQSFSESVYNGLRDFYNTDTNTKNVIPQTASDRSIAEGNGIWKRPGVNDDSRINTYRTVVVDGSKIVIASGFNQESALKQIASTDVTNASVHDEFADVGFIFVDGQISGNGYDPKNISSITYRADNGSFLVGVATAVYLNKHWDLFASGSTPPATIGVSGFVGLPISSTLSYLNGFRQGLAYWNNIADYIRIGDDNNLKPAIKMKWVTPEANNYGIDKFTSGSFESNSPQAINLVRKLITNDAKVIFPIAGPQTQLAVGQVGQSGENVMVIGVDTPQENDNSLKQPMPKATDNNIIAFSSLKNLDYSVQHVLNAIKTGTPLPSAQTTSDTQASSSTNQTTSATYYGFGALNIGDLGNGGVGISDAGKQYLIDPLFFTQDSSDSTKKKLDASSSSGSNTSTGQTYDVRTLTNGTVYWKLESITTGQEANNYTQLQVKYAKLLDDTTKVKTLGNTTGSWKITGQELQQAAGGDDNTFLPALTGGEYVIKDAFGATASKRVISADSQALDGTGWTFAITRG